MEAVTDIMGLWPSIEAFAEDAGVTVGLARVWKTRQSIPSKYWARLAANAKRHGVSGVTTDRLATLASEAA